MPVSTLNMQFAIIQMWWLVLLCNFNRRYISWFILKGLSFGYLYDIMILGGYCFFSGRYDALNTTIKNM